MTTITSGFSLCHNEVFNVNNCRMSFLDPFIFIIFHSSSSTWQEVTSQPWISMTFRPAFPNSLLPTMCLILGKLHLKKNLPLYQQQKGEHFSNSQLLINADFILYGVTPHLAPGFSLALCTKYWSLWIHHWKCGVPGKNMLRWCSIVRKTIVSWRSHIATSKFDVLIIQPRLEHFCQAKIFDFFKKCYSKLGRWFLFLHFFARRANAT